MSAIRGTPYPNRLLEASVSLPETQLRLLNLVVRSTLGWKAELPGERRSHMSATLAQLKRRVGRASTLAVAEAAAGLMHKGLVELRGEDGGPLDARDLYPSYKAKLRIALSREWVEEEWSPPSRAVEN